jgi:hypothetical protein
MPAAAMIPASTWKAAEKPSLSALAGRASARRALVVWLVAIVMRAAIPIAPQDQDVVVVAMRWLLSGLPGGGVQPGPRKR